MDMERIKDLISTFSKQRDWDKFHNPKNLAMALSVETSELVEIFQWLTEEQSNNLPNDKLKEVEEEIADVFIYLLRLSDKLGIDILDAANNKIKQNAIKYPANQVRGSSKKYTEYE